MLRTSPSIKRNNYLSFGIGRSDSPPPLPGFDSSGKRKRKSLFGFGASRRFLPNGLDSFLSTHPRSVKSILAIFLLLTLLYWLFNTVLILFRFKIADGLLSSSWTSVGLKIRKPPLIFVHSSQSAAIVWESNKMASSSGHQLGLRYWTIGVGYKNQTISMSSKTERRLKFSTGKVSDVRRARPEGDGGWRRWVHTALIEDLEPGTTYGYEIVLLNAHSKSKQSDRFDAIKKVYSKHRFTWYGIDPLDLTTEHHVLSAVSPTSKYPLDVLHIIVIGDNQFGVKVFKNLVRRFMDLKSYLPKLKSSLGPRQIVHHFYPTPIKPSLIFHLGDAVQRVDNLKQWQTDFWDPLTFKNKLISEVPIVYTKGNHDFDSTGHNLYSGGLPKVQVGEMNRTQTAKLSVNTPLEIPGIAEADKSFTTFKAHDRAPGSRGTYFSYSPHPRVRVIVCDSNLETTRMILPGSTMTEVDEHERWLLWEMARPEWKEASIRIVLVHIPPFVEFWDQTMWTRGHESHWGHYVRERFAPHFHALSPETSRYDIPGASMVISGHSHAYNRGMLSNFVASDYFRTTESSHVPMETKKTARAQNKLVYDPNNPQQDFGVVYVVTGGAGGPLDHERVEEWGFYERSITKKYHFNHLQLDMSQTLLSLNEWTEDWSDSKLKRLSYKDKKLRVYKLVGSQLVCRGTEENSNSKVWEGGRYRATDRLIWTTRAIDGRVLDRFVIEADSCR